MESQLNKIMQFVENGGRFHKGVEPKYGEPFYADYMKQYISENFTLGDKLHIKTDSAEFDGILLDISWNYIYFLIAGRKVHKDKRNKKDVWSGDIKEITRMEKASDTFDLAAVDHDLWEHKQLPIEDKNARKRCEYEYKRRNENKAEFNSIYPDVDFDKCHVIKIDDGIGIYFPFCSEKITADIAIMHGSDCVKKITCTVGTPFPNKNHYRAYNSKGKDLWYYLPDNGFIYENVNIVCTWTVAANGLAAPLKFLAIHHFDKILPVKNDENMIIIDLCIYPLLGYGKSLFSTDSVFLSRMMDKDLYCILYPNNYSAIIVKQPETIESEKLEDLLYSAALGVNDFDQQSILQALIEDDYATTVEAFFNIDEEPDQYFSDSWRNGQKFFKFKKLEGDHTICMEKK